MAEGNMKSKNTYDDNFKAAGSSVTWLFVPATRPERFAKAIESGADAIIIDLEDAVGVSEKLQARVALATGFPTSGQVLVRINGFGTSWHPDDVAAIRDLPIGGVVVPKAESVADMVALNNTLDHRVPLVALIESAAGIGAAREIARAACVARLAFGSIDFAADVGCAHNSDALLLARLELVLASRMSGLSGPIDGVASDVSDNVLARRDSAYAASLGFAGKLCVHPRQVVPVREGFAPNAEEIAWARRIVSATKSGEGVVKVDGAMVDTPVLLRAEKILSRIR